ncbi:MAG: hypothetical protein LBG92_04595 [Prevotellaceae bacterium]|jgi:hypothetical protein|nr:hypothetical protein [Prevotellaceae bacterium]
MNKNVFFIIIVATGLFLTACDPVSTYIGRTNHYITNTTGKRIVHELVGNTYFLPNEMSMSDTVRRFYSNGTVLTKEFEWSFSRSMSMQWDYPDMMISETRIYNINDTVSLAWDVIWYGEDRNYDQFYERECNESRVSYYTYNLMVSDSLLSLMHKDYTMLEKFPEYYK